LAKGRLRWLLKSRGAEFALVVAFCITSSCQSSTPTSTGAADFKVALRTPGPVSDAGVNAAAFHGRIYAFGANGDQNAVAPDNVLALAP
jgi:basic membrane lipoprotein Med (substrate-binding protein (PBP1-ABC) superfamily)